MSSGVEVKNIFKEDTTPRSNISREERRAIIELKKDDSRLILATDKGIAIGVMNKERYIMQAENVLNQPTYKILSVDSTNRQKNKLINLLISIKAEDGISEETYRRLYSTGAGSPKFYGLPKNPQVRDPLRPIVSSRDTVSYATAKECVRILKPLVGRSIHHVQNTKDFVQHLRHIKLLQDECITSFDVKALFTSVPITSVINTIRDPLTKDQGLQNRTSMTVQQIIYLLEFCLKNTYFVFQGKYYEQLEGATMGSPISPI